MTRIRTRTIKNQLEYLESRILLSVVPMDTHALQTLFPQMAYGAGVCAVMMPAPNAAAQPASAGKAAAPTGTVLAPTNLSATVISATQVNLAWTASAGATGYYVYRNASQIGTVVGGTATTYADTSVAASTLYTYYLKAYQTAKGKTTVSGLSNSVVVTTPAPPAPTVLNISQRYDDGEFVIAGTSDNDSIIVTQSGGVLTINGIATPVPSSTYGLFIYSFGGSDTITVDSSVTLRTTIATIDGSGTIIVNNAVNASIWIDSTDVFSGVGSVHKVANFYEGVSKGIGIDIADPTPSSSDFSTKIRVSASLWGAGPVIGDVNQGSIGDCYFLGSLAAFANTTPDTLQNRAVDLGDGTYVVEYLRGGSGSYVRVDGDVVVGPWNGFYNAQPGATGDIWALIMEKSYAYFRYGLNTYASIEGGWMTDVYTDFGIANKNFILPSDKTVFATVSNALANDKPVTFATYNSNSITLVPNHVYTLVSVRTSGGVNYYTVRNPWGVKGDALEDSLGYATLTFAQMKLNFRLGTVAL
jgi:hypothetical protein